MYKTTIAALAAASLFALTACNQQPAAGNNATSTAAAADAIDGTWKADLASVQIDQKPDELLLKDGKFDCATCTPPLTVAADGAFHAVTGRPYADEISVKADDDHNVTRTDKKGGKVVGDNKFSVSADGKTLTVSFTDSSTPDAKPVTGNYTETRVAAAPAGAHAISGSWKPEKYNSVTEEGLTTTYQLAGDTLNMSSPAGQSYSAKIGGPEAPIKGDIGGTTVTVEKVDGGIRETYHRDGKVTGVATSTVGADGKMSVTYENKQNGSTTKYTASKS